MNPKHLDRRRREGVPVRCTVDQIGETKVRYTCPEGHTWSEDLARKSLKTKRLGPTGAKLMIDWWTTSGGVTANCRKCGEASGLAPGSSQ